MCETQLFTAKQWKEITKRAEEQGNYLLTTIGGFAFFAEKRLIDDFYLILNETTCSVCKEKVHAAYHQWKKDDWYPVCPSCFT